MKISDKIWILFILILFSIHFGMLFTLAPDNSVSEKKLEEAWNNGYNQHIEDYYIPAPGLPEQEEAIPMKKPNSDLKEKFKG